MSRAPITVVVTTYFPPGEDGASRVDTAIASVSTWQDFLHYDGEIRMHVADDGSDPEHLERFRDYCDKMVDTATTQERHGVGASLNAGLRHAFETSPLALYAVDDWMLTGHFDLTPWADLLADEGNNVGVVRLGPPHPWLTGTIVGYPQGWALKLDRHHFAFGHRPALYHRRIVPSYGWFVEDVNAYECERLYNEVFISNAGPDIVLALPTPWMPEPASVELAHIEPRDLS